MLSKRNVAAFFTILMAIYAHYAEGFFCNEKEKEKELSVMTISSFLEERETLARQSRKLAHGLLIGNTCALLKGNLAQPTLVSSALVVKILYETDDYSSDDDGTTAWKAGISLFFSAIASLNGWLLREVRARSAEKAAGVPSNLVHTLLLLGSRGMELVGGFLLAFIQMMQL